MSSRWCWQVRGLEQCKWCAEWCCCSNQVLPNRLEHSAGPEARSMNSMGGATAAIIGKKLSFDTLNCRCDRWATDSDGPSRTCTICKEQFRV